MAKLYGEIAAKSLLTLDKSFARANGQPADASEVHYSLAAAKAYAATAQAYIGQKIVVIEEGIVSHYSVEDEAGTLKELGSKPVADGTTIEIDEDGKITLANIADKAEGTYNAVLVNGELTWVAPSATTVEGLSDLITALTGRVTTLEETVNGKAAQGVEGEDGYVPAVKGLVEKLSDEVARATAAEEALGERIDAIDFVDADELAEAIKDFATDTEVADAVKVAQDKADEAYELAETKVDADTYATDKKALEDEDAAIREIAEAAKARIDIFMDEEGVADVVDSLHDIKAELDKMAEATELVDALALKADLSYVNDELAKKQDVIADGTYATPGDVDTAKSEAIADAEGKIATAKQEAIDAAASAAAGIYATKAEVEELETELDERLDVLEAINHDLYASKEEFEAHVEEAEKTFATKDELNDVEDKADGNTNLITNLTNRLDGIVAQGGEPNTINTIKVNGVAQSIDSEKAVDITVPTKFSDITDDSGFGDRIDAAQTKANEAANAAAAAQTSANQAQSEVDALELVVGELNTTVAGHKDTLADHSGRIVALENADTAHKAEYDALKVIVDGHTTTIASKADATALAATDAKVSGNETAIKVINETTIPAVQSALEGEIAKKADASALANYYAKTEVDAIIGDKAEDKTIVEMIEDAKTAATYDDTAVKKLISDEVARAEEAEAGLADEISRLDAAIQAVIDDENGETLNSIKDLAVWVEEHESEVLPAIQANTDAIAAINDADKGILAVAKKYTDDSIAGLPAATAEALGLVKYDDDTIKMNDDKQLYVAKVSTDVLVQGVETLVLNGGSANA